MEPSSPARRRTISAILIDAAAVTSEQVELAIARHRDTGCRIGEALVQLGFVSEEDIGWALAHQLELPFVDVRLDMLDPELVRSFPEGALRRLQVVPLFRAEGRLTAAAADPTDHDAIVELERLAETPVAYVAATPTAIGRALDALLGHAHGAHARHGESRGPAGIGVIWERSGESFLDFQIAEAVRLGAHELHFGCANSWLHVRHRSGTRVPTVSLEPASVMDVLLTRLEALGMRPLEGRDEHRAFRAEVREHALAVSVLASGGDVTVTIALSRRDEAPRLDTLGFEPLDLAQLRDAALAPSGLVLVCGPARSGTSTTLAALLAEQPRDERRWAVFTPGGWPGAGASSTVDRIGDALAAQWPQVAAAHGLDGVVLDAPADERLLLADGAHGRLVFARSAACDTCELLARLARSDGGVLAARLRAVVQQRLVAAPAPGTGAPAAPATPVFELLFPSGALREALRRGAGAAELRAIAGADGRRALGDTLAALVRDGRADARDAERAVA
ncbi:MAG: hypothetical protein U0704_06185 [Candidatus Eisenbacteria bacterium]